MRIYLLLCLALLSCCGQKLPPIPGTVKVYEIREDKGGLIRLQVQETLPFVRGAGYLCASPQHFGDIVSCTGGGVRVYELNPKLGGIFRKQANDLMTYEEARGYLCVSPQHMNDIQDKCAK